MANNNTYRNAEVDLLEPNLDRRMSRPGPIRVPFAANAGVTAAGLACARVGAGQMDRQIDSCKFVESRTRGSLTWAQPHRRVAVLVAG